jgi:hypothetical protein
MKSVDRALLLLNAALNRAAAAAAMAATEGAPDFEMEGIAAKIREAIRELDAPPPLSGTAKAAATVTVELGEIVPFDAEAALDAEIAPILAALDRACEVHNLPLLLSICYAARPAASKDVDLDLLTHLRYYGRGIVHIFDVVQKMLVGSPIVLVGSPIVPAGKGQ